MKHNAADGLFMKPSSFLVPGCKDMGNIFLSSPYNGKTFILSPNPECIAFDMIFSNLLYLLTINESVFSGMLIAQRMFSDYGFRGSVVVTLNGEL